MGKQDNYEDIKMLGKIVTEVESTYTIVNDDKVKLVKDTGKTMEKILDGVDITVEVDLFEPFKNSGSITIEGEYIIVNDRDTFAKAIESCDTFEIITKTNGKTQVNFGYSGLMEAPSDEN